MDWTKLAPLIFGSSVLAAFLTQALGLFKDAWNRRRDADFAALYVALALERYASQCATIVGDFDNHRSSSGGHGERWENVTAFPEVTGVEWKALGIKLTTEIMSFGVRVDSTREMLAELGSLDGEAAVTDAREHAVRLGVRALDIADHLRRARRLPSRTNGSGDWSTRDWLMEKLRKVEATRLARETDPDPLGLN